MRWSPSRQCPAAASRPTTPRTWAAVTSVSSSPGPSRTASSGAVQLVRPGSSAATTEYGHPRIICAFPLGLDSAPLPCHAERHGHRLSLQVLSQEREDHRAVAVSRQDPRPAGVKRQAKSMTNGTSTQSRGAPEGGGGRSGDGGGGRGGE